MIFNKQKWKEYSFSMLAECIEKHDKNASQNGYDKFIGLENLDGDKLKVTGYGLIENGTTFSKTFKYGDVLFGKRRPYLRKVAVADFNGICSGDILVFRAKRDIILPQLLPFYVSSDRFIQHAVNTSAGSLSPRTKWKDLAGYSIRLPSIAEQTQIVELFQSIELAIEQTLQQEKNLKSLNKNLIDGFVSDKPIFGSLLVNRVLMKVSYSEIANKLMRKIDPLVTDIERIVAGENLESEDFKIRTWGTIGKDFLGPAFHVLFKFGDILYGSRRTYLKKVALADFEGVCANTTYVIRADEKKILQGLLKHIMLSERFTQYSIGVSKGSTNPYINWKDLDNFSFQIPDLKVQREMVMVLDSIVELIEQYKTQIGTLKNLKQKLLNDILG